MSPSPYQGNHGQKMIVDKAYYLCTISSSLLDIMKGRGKDKSGQGVLSLDNQDMQLGGALAVQCSMQQEGGKLIH